MSRPSAGCVTVGPPTRTLLLSLLALLATACSAQARVNAADRAWEDLVEENGDTYSWVHYSENHIDEANWTTTHFVEDGELVRRVQERRPGLSGGETEIIEETSPDELESGLSTIPSWHDECRRVLGYGSPLERSMVEINDDGLVFRCELPGDSITFERMTGVSFD